MDALVRRGYTEFVRLDSGGQANVYKSAKNGKPYAIKVVPIEEKDKVKLDEDLRRELLISKNIGHANCIHVEDLFRSSTRMYIVLDFMPNGNIGNHVRTHGPLNEWNAKAWFTGIAGAIRYLHTHDIAHRDLKLDNVLLDDQLNPIVTDFGFSRFVDRTETGQLKLSKSHCGTRSHFAPEILMKNLYNPFKVDIWCLGVMLFIMVNQDYPFNKKMKDHEMNACQMNRDYRLQPSIKVSADLKDLIQFMLEPDQFKRPDIGAICGHCWFPLMFQKAEYLKQTKKPIANKCTPTT